MMKILIKKLVKTAIFFLILAVLAGCKTREKQVQKSETQTEIKLVTLKSQRKPPHFSRGSCQQEQDLA